MASEGHGYGSADWARFFPFFRRDVTYRFLAMQVSPRVCVLPLYPSSGEWVRVVKWCIFSLYCRYRGRKMRWLEGWCVPTSIFRYAYMCIDGFAPSAPRDRPAVSLYRKGGGAFLSKWVSCCGNVSRAGLLGMLTRPCRIVLVPRRGLARATYD